MDLLKAAQKRSAPEPLPKQKAPDNLETPPVEEKLQDVLTGIQDVMKEFPAKSEPASMLDGMARQLTMILNKVRGQQVPMAGEVPGGPAAPMEESGPMGGAMSPFPASPTEAGGHPFVE